MTTDLSLATRGLKAQLPMKVDIRWGGHLQAKVEGGGLMRNGLTTDGEAALCQHYRLGQV